MDKITAIAIEQKSVVNIEDGYIVGRQSKCVVDKETRRFAGLMVDGEENNFIGADKIMSFDADVVIVKDDTVSSPVTYVNPIGAMLLTNTGLLIGRVLDMSFSKEGELIEFLVSGDNDKRPTPFVIKGSKVMKIGQEAIFCYALNEEDFIEADNALYRLSLAKAGGAHNERSDEQKFEERFEQMTGRVSKSVNDLGHMVSSRLKQIDKEAIASELGKFSEFVNKEVSQFIDSVADNFSSAKKDLNEKDVQAVLNDLADHTVSKPVNDKTGQVIIMPGQRISEDNVIATIRAEKVAELYRVATPMKPEERRTEVESQKE